jgi:nicotinate-nucleotide adenylyltransferase
MSSTVAVYGGSFDPPHVAHVMAAAWVLSAAPVDELWVMPVAQHALGKLAVAPFGDRLDLCRAAFADLGGRVQVRDDEAREGGTGRTLDLLDHLQQQYPGVAWRLVVGSDILHERDRWHAFGAILRRAPLIVLPRPGFSVPAEFAHSAAPIVLPELSSTDLRARLRARAELAGLVPRAVADLILARGLYL